MESLEAIPAFLLKFSNLSLSSVGVLVGAALLYWGFCRGLTSLESHNYLPSPLVSTFRRIGFWMLAIASVLLILQILGVLRSVVTGVMGVLALVSIGFVAVWSVLSNTLFSLILMITRPFRIGDTIAFPPDEFRGKVVNFNLLFTTMETEDGMLLQVPNNTFFQRPILRKKGAWQIGLSDQLYESENATARLARDKSLESQQAA